MERTLWCISFQNGSEDTCKAKDVLHLGLLDHPTGWLQIICTELSNRNYLHLMLSPYWLLVAPIQDTRLRRDGVDLTSKILDKMWHTMLSTHMQDEEKILLWTPISIIRCPELKEYEMVQSTFWTPKSHSFNYTLPPPPHSLHPHTPSTPTHIKKLFSKIDMLCILDASRLGCYALERTWLTKKIKSHQSSQNNSSRLEYQFVNVHCVVS